MSTSEPTSTWPRHTHRRTGAGGRHRGLRVLLRSPHFAALTVIGLCVLAVNAPTLLHIVTTNPVQLFAGLQLEVSHPLFSGGPTIDPNAGFVTQSLGHVAASDWLHGTVPWWNPYEGIGAPLAGEMQSAAFFPATLLLYGTWGFVLFHFLLELLAGWATYFLLRRLGTGRPAATAAGIAFGLCGTFAWFSHAPANPVAFLPLALVGVERCLDTAHARRRGGWVLLAVALGLSIVAGFPEVAYIDGLLIALWAAVRIASAKGVRARLVMKLGGGAGVALLLSAPVLVAFVTYLPNANVGGHGGEFGNLFLVSQALPQLILPYVYGPIFAFHTNSVSDVFVLIWGNVGGYISALLAFCGLVGLVGKRLRSLRLALGAWTAIALAKIYGLAPFAHLVTHIPGLGSTATYRYSPPSWELAVIVLAALGIDDMARGKVRPRVVVAAATVIVIVSAWAVVTAWPVLNAVAGTAHHHIYAAFSALWAALSVCVAAGAGLLTRRARTSVAAAPRRIDWGRTGPRLMAGIVIFDAMALFALPLFSAPPPQPVDLAVVSFLQQHLGAERFTTLGPISPNFGSYFGISEVNVNDLPVPKSYSHYVEKNLDPNANPLVFTGTVSNNPAGPTPGQELWKHLANYEALGVKYVVEGASGTDSGGVAWPPKSGAASIKLVYQDTISRVYELPAPAPLFSTLGGGCAVRTISWDAAMVHCAQPTVLVRRELSLPGWTATVGGQPSLVRPIDKIFEATAVPAGSYEVRFAFSPPHANLALVACVVGIALVIAAVLMEFFFARRRTRAQPRTPASP